MSIVEWLGASINYDDKQKGGGWPNVMNKIYQRKGRDVPKNLKVLTTYSMNGPIDIRTPSVNDKPTDGHKPRVYGFINFRVGWWSYLLLLVSCKTFMLKSGT